VDTVLALALLGAAWLVEVGVPRRSLGERNEMSSAIRTESEWRFMMHVPWAWAVHLTIWVAAACLMLVGADLAGPFVAALALFFAGICVFIRGAARYARDHREGEARLAKRITLRLVDEGVEVERDGERIVWRDPPKLCVVRTRGSMPMGTGIEHGTVDVEAHGVVLALEGTQLRVAEFVDEQRARELAEDIASWLGSPPPDNAPVHYRAPARARDPWAPPSVRAQPDAGLPMSGQLLLVVLSMVVSVVDVGMLVVLARQWDAVLAVGAFVALPAALNVGLRAL
jgi:hypothetical protein